MVAPGIGIWDWNPSLWGFLKSFMLNPSPPPKPPHYIAQTKLNGMYPEGVMAHTISGIFDTVLILL